MNNEFSILLVDISNTRTKFMRITDGTLLPELRIIPTAELNSSSLPTLLQEWRYAAACVSSVVPAKAQVLADCLSVPVHFISARDENLVDFSAYPGAATLGADRVANAVAAARYGKFPLVAVDMGTATTFDVVVLRGNKPTFIGGSIAPGLACLRRFFHRSTAQLPPVEPSARPQAIGQNTMQAMQGGLLLGYRGLLREILAGVAEECGEVPHVYATGGDAELMAALMPGTFRQCPKLTFEGLAALAEHHFSSLLAENPS